MPLKYYKWKYGLHDIEVIGLMIGARGIITTFFKSFYMRFNIKEEITKKEVQFTIRSSICILWTEPWHKHKSWSAKLKSISHYLFSSLRHRKRENCDYYLNGPWVAGRWLLWLSSFRMLSSFFHPLDLAVTNNQQKYTSWAKEHQENKY